MDASKVVVAQAKDRIAKIPSKLLKEYISRDAAGNILKICCRMCSTPIQDWVEDDVVEIQRHHGVRREVVRMKFRRLMNYTQVVFKLDDGALYEPPVCSDCAPKIKLEHGECLFACHLAEVVRSGNVLNIADQNGYTVKEYLGIKEGY